MKGFAIPEHQAVTTGVVNVSDWLMAPDGQSYQHFWTERWEVFTDAMLAEALPKFKSQEHWTLAAVIDGQVRLLIPGCCVRGWAYTPEPPQNPSCYQIR